MPAAFRRGCRLCGECDIGCNDGAKNSLDYNYLTLAHQKGADIRVRHDVKEFEPHPKGGYVVRYRDLTDYEGVERQARARGASCAARCSSCRRVRSARRI